MVKRYIAVYLGYLWSIFHVVHRICVILFHWQQESYKDLSQKLPEYDLAANN